MSRRQKQRSREDLYKLVFLIMIIPANNVLKSTGSLILAGLTLASPIIIFYIGRTFYRKHKNRILLESGIDIIDRMSGEEFEKFLKVYYESQGYRADLTPSTADYGADLVMKKDKRKIVVQAKRWSKTVGIESVQQVIGAIRHYGASKGIVVTNSTYTENAYNLANSNGVELIDRRQLIDMLKYVKGRDIANQVGNEDVKIRLEDSVQNENIPQCPQCGKTLLLRSGKNGRFYGCQGFPLCKFTKNATI